LNEPPGGWIVSEYRSHDGSRSRQRPAGFGFEVAKGPPVHVAVVAPPETVPPAGVAASAPAAASAATAVVTAAKRALRMLTPREGEKKPQKANARLSPVDTHSKRAVS
jgi:hypothetical protein